MKIITLLLSLLLLASCGSHEHEASESAHLALLFPQGILRADQRPADTQLLANKSIALFFTSDNNPQTPELAVFLEELAVQYDYRFAVVVINTGSDTVKFQRSIERFGDAFYTLNDKEAARFTKEYQITVEPSVIVLDSQGKLITRQGIKPIINNYPRLPGGWM